MQRRRGKQLETALLDAAWDELHERGYAGFALESVAKRAGTSTPVIYRRWPDRASMIEAAIVHAGDARAIEIPDTGTLRGDLIALMRSANDSRVDLLAATTALLGSYFDEAGTNPARLREQMLRGRRSAAETMMQRAVARGEVRTEVVTPRLTSLPFDLFRHEVLMTLQPVPDDVITQIVDEFFIPLVRPAADTRGPS